VTFKGRKLGGTSKTAELAIWIILVSISLPLTLAVILVFVNLDSLSYILPRTENNLINTAFVLLRLANASLATYVGWLNLATYFIFTIIQMRILSAVNSVFAIWVDHRAGLVRKQDRKVHCNIKSASLKTVFLAHRQTRIFLLVLNEAHYFSLPILLQFGQCILVLSSYATIKLSDRIPMPFYLCMPFLALYVIVIIMSLFPYAANIYEESSRFLRLAQGSIKLSRYWRKSWRSETALRVQFGQFFYAKRKTKTTFFSCCLNLTLDSILTY
jgi:hypothetical protein